MFTTQIYSWQDAGAPSLAYTVGSLKTVLDAVLVAGYNSKTVTAVRTSNVVTVTSTAHGRVTGDYITRTGATGDTSFNGIFKITVTDADHYTHASTGADGSAAGTLTDIKTPAGWATPYSASGTTQGYRSPLNQRWAQHVGGSAQYDSLVGYSSMSSATVGLEATTGQAVYKNIGTGVANPWYIVATGGGKMIHLFIAPNNSAADSFASCTWDYSYFGEFDSYAPSDVYNFIVGGNGSSSTLQSNLQAYQHGQQSNFRILRNWDNNVVVPTCHFDIDWQAAGITTNAGQLGNGGRSYPDKTSGGIDVRKAHIWEDSYSRRGTIQGLYFPTQSLRVAEGANKKFTCTSGNLNGKILQSFALAIATTTCVLIDISDT